MAAAKRHQRAAGGPLLKGSSPVKAAALAALLEAPGHGYEVARRVNRQMGGSWQVQPSHIYAVLEQLEEAGLVGSEAEPISEPPYWRRIYHPTAIAEQARRDWLNTPPATSIIRVDIYARLVFSHEEDVPQLLRALGEYRADLLEAIERNAVSGTPPVSWLGHVLSLSRAAVDMRLKGEIEWVGEVTRELEGILAQHDAGVAEHGEVSWRPAEEKPLLDGASPVKAAALAVLLEAPGHGYDVARRVNRQMGGSWRVQPKHIYSFLKRLEQAGLVMSKAQPVPGSTRTRKVYYPAEKAEQARLAWLDTPPAVSIVRVDMHARLAYSRAEDAPQLLRALGEYRADLLEAIERNVASETPPVSWLERVLGLSRAAVDKRLKGEIAWVEEVARELDGFVAERGAR
jgi:PadR family transcriptional regulator, regulatory protein PadR